MEIRARDVAFGVTDGIQRYLRLQAAELERSLRLVPGEQPLRLEEIYIPVRVSTKPRRDLAEDLRREVERARGDREDLDEELYSTRRREEDFERQRGGDPEPVVRAWSVLRRGLTRPVAVLGDPGYGKSTTIAWEFAELAREWEEGLSEGVDNPLPVHLLAAELAQAQDPIEAVVSAVVPEESPSLENEVLLGELRARIRSGRIVYLVDALDQVPRDARRNFDRQLRALWEAAAFEGRPRIVLSSRLAGFVAPEGLEWKQFELVAWGREEIRRFVESYFREDPLRQQVIRALEREPAMRGLAQVPLLLAMLCSVAERKGQESGERKPKEGDVLPRSRGELYQEFLYLLLGRSAAQRPARAGDRATPAQKIPLLAHLALTYQRAEYDYLGPVDLDQVLRQHEGFDAVFGGRDPVRELSVEDGLLLRTWRSDQAPLYFLHRTLQEFLASWALARDEGWLAEVREHFWFDPRWEEVIALLAGELGEPRTAGRPEELIEAILADEEDIFGSMLLLAVRCAAEARRLPEALLDRLELQVIDAWEESIRPGGEAIALNMLRIFAAMGRVLSRHR